MDIATRNASVVIETPGRSLLTSLFAIDTRSLAAVRIGLGAILLHDAFVNFTPASPEAFHYSSVLILPFAAALLVGYKTRVATVACWLTYGLPIREGLVPGGPGVFYGKYVVVVFLFWAMFLPLGATFSIDSKSGSQQVGRILSVATAATLVQLFFVYFFAGINKDFGEWLFDASAMKTILGSTRFGTEFGESVARFDSAMSALSVATIALEVLGSILLFVPGRSLFTRRTVLVGIFAVFHLGMAATMHVRTFPFIMITVLMLFVPSTLWDNLGMGRMTGQRLDIDRNPVSNFIPGVALFYIVVSNYITWMSASSPSGFAQKWQDFGMFLLLLQQWAMFSIPSTIA